MTSAARHTSSRKSGTSRHSLLDIDLMVDLTSPRSMRLSIACSLISDTTLLVSSPVEVLLPRKTLFAAKPPSKPMCRSAITMLLSPPSRVSAGWSGIMPNCSIKDIPQGAD